MRTRLKRGEGRSGPDYRGCINSGLQPVILRSRRTGVYMVGPELAVRTVARMAGHMELPRTCWVNEGQGLIHRSDSKREHRRKVRAFKGSGPAWREFEALCNAVRALNEQDRQREQAALKAYERDPHGEGLKQVLNTC